MKLCVTLVILLLSGGTALAEGLSNDWLKIVSLAAHQVEYSGVFVYLSDNELETSSITHIVQADSEYEKVSTLDGSKREIIRHHGQTWNYLDNRMVQMDRQQEHGKFPSLLAEQLSASRANYLAIKSGIERVAGYNAQVILFNPMDNYRYAHKIWVHIDSGLILKVAVLGDKNQPIEQYVFTHLQIGGTIDRSWVVAKEAAQHGLLESPEAAGVDINSGWVVDAMPRGFKKIKEIQRPMPGKHTRVTQIVYSDGLSGISIFVEPADGDENDKDGLTIRGALNLHHKVIRKQLITAVGEVPSRTVLQVLDSVRYNGK